MKTVCVAAAVIRDGDRVFAAQRAGGGWEFPGGKMEEGESREVALVREIWEELSVMIMPEKWLCTVEHDYPTFHLKMHCALCHIVQGMMRKNEHKAIQWLAMDELDSLNWLLADVEAIKVLKK